jgi:hypothetical protein
MARLIRLWDRITDRLRTVWNTLTDEPNARLLLTGPLPLWMQEAFEREAERQGVGVGTIIFAELRAAAQAMIEDHPMSVAQEQ